VSIIVEGACKMDFIFLLIIFFIAFVSIKNQDLDTQQLSIKTTSNLQVIAVIFVILHHLSQVLQNYSDSFLSSRLIVAGRFSVGIFFFVSGYGLIKQYKKKGRVYLDTFLKRKVLSIFIPFLLAGIVYFIFRNLIGKLSLGDAFYSLINGSPVVSNGWFVIMIIFLYFAFFVSAFIARKNDLLLTILLVTSTILVLVIAKYMHYGEWWTNAIFCFPLGVVWSINEKLILDFLFNKYKVSVMVLVVLFSGFFYLDEVFYHPVIRAFSVLFFVSIVILLSYRVTFQNPIFSYVKVISFELYLYQGLFIQLFRSNVLFIDNRLIYVCLVILATSILAFLMYYVANLFSFLNKG